MKRFNRVVVLMLVVILLTMLLPFIVVAESSVEKGKEDLSKLTYKELSGLLDDIDSDIKVYHTPTGAQEKLVLSATKKEAEGYYAKKGTKVDGWAWYDFEYEYTKAWDFYTLSTHLDYLDSEKKSHHADVYSEVYDVGGTYKVAYLKVAGGVVLDNRSEYGTTLWTKTPTARINKSSNIDLSTYSIKDLSALADKANREINTNHSVLSGAQSMILSLTKIDLEQYFMEKNLILKSYAWYDREYKYTRDWDYYWLETHVDYKTSENASQQTDKIYSEVCNIDGRFELVYLKFGSKVIKDRKNELSSTLVDGIPKYSWSTAGETQKEESEQLPVTGSETRSIESGDTLSSSNSGQENTSGSPDEWKCPSCGAILTSKFCPDCGTTRDDNGDKVEDPVPVTEAPAEVPAENQTEALTQVQTEVPAEAMTPEPTPDNSPDRSIKITSTQSSVEAKRQLKLTAEVERLKEEAPKKSVLTWSSSNEKIAKVSQQGVVTGVSTGKVVITCCIKDNPEIKCDYTVTVIKKVTAIKLSESKVNIAAGYSGTVTVTFQPADATDKGLTWSSSDPSVAQVSGGSNGSCTITAMKRGDCVITAVTKDGSNRKASVKVHVPSFGVFQSEYKVSSKKGLTFPIQWGGSSVTLYNKSSKLFDADWVGDEVFINPKKAGKGYIELVSEDSSKEKIRVNIVIESSAVYDVVSYPTFVYSAILRNPSGYKGRQGHIRGRVLQVSSSWGKTILRVGTTGYFDSDNVFWVECDSRVLNVNVIEDDRISVYGTCTGTHSYTTILGASITIPSIKAEKVAFD